MNSTTASLSLLNNRAKGQIQLCDQKDQIHKDDGIFRHVTTPNVARDMISIIDAWDEWRATTAVKDQSLDATTARGYTLNTKGKLMYWGFSYGVSLEQYLRTTLTVVDTSWRNIRSVISRSCWSCSPRRCS